MPMHFVTIKGDDLEYFKVLVQQALSGDFGELTEVRMSVSERGVVIGTNGLASECFGETDCFTD